MTMARTLSVGAWPRIRVRWSFLLTAAAIVGAAHLAFQFCVWLPRAWNDARETRDVHQVYTAALAAAGQGPLYEPWPAYDPDLSADGYTFPERRFPYPPFLAPALSPLSAAPFVVFQRVWWLVSIAAFWVFAACLARIGSGAASVRNTLVAGALLGSVPGAYHTISIGNVDPLLWAFVGVSLAFVRLRGVGFTAGALVKLFGFWPALFAWLREGRRVLLGAAATVAAATAVSVAVLGAQRFLESAAAWSRYMLPAISQGMFGNQNLSLSIAGLRVLRLFHVGYAAGPLPAWARAYMLLAGTVAPLATGWLLRRRSVEVQASAVCCAALVFGPIFWWTYLPLFLAPAAALIGERRTGRLSRSRLT